MPRFENTDLPGHSEIHDACTASGNGSSTFDLCAACARGAEGVTLADFDLAPYNGEPAGILTNTYCHPPYSDSEYCCNCCGDDLTDDDN